jgi:3-oxoacyl-[acyl-carrier protein] reductase
VLVNDIDADPANETADLIRAAGGQAEVGIFDTVDLSNARELISHTVSTFGRLDILVNNAGASRDRMFHNLDDGQFQFVFDVNFTTGFHTTLAAMPYLRDAAKAEIAAGGKPRYHRKITFTSSIVALTGNPGQYNYTAAKGAIIATTKTLARELGPFWINVNAVAPGFIETRMTDPRQPGSDQGVPEQMRDQALTMIALGRRGRPEDVANVHAFLVSPDADYVSGVTVPVTGGQFGGMG